MDELKIPLKLTRLVKLTTKNMISQVQIQSTLSKPLEIYNGLRQGDALACPLFSIALEKAVRISGIQTTSRTFTKSVQILVYADRLI
jgi:hypothetical protein